MQRETFGDMLYDARRRQGITIEEAARVIRVRERFLDAFERCDFDEMPPSGYAQNMIVSYARFLRINPEPIVIAYRRDLNNWKIASSFDRDLQDPLDGDYPPQRPTDPYRQPEMDEHRNLRTRDSRARTARRGTSQRAGARSTGNRGSSGRPSSKRGGKNGRGRKTREGRQRARKQRAQPPATLGERLLRALRSLADLLSRRNGNAETNRARSRAARNMNADELADDVIRERGTATYNTYKQLPVNRRTMLFGIGIVAVIAIVFSIFIVSSCQRGQEVQTESPAPVVGTTSLSSQSEGEQATTTNGKPFKISFSVDADATSEIKVTVDGESAYEGTAAGPITESFTVSKTVKITIGKPDVVTIKMNDTEVQPKVGSDGTGIVNLSTS